MPLLLPIQKISAQSVFLASAGASIWITALFAITSTPSPSNVIIILYWLEIAAVLIAIGFHVSNSLRLKKHSIIREAR